MKSLTVLLPDRITWKSILIDIFALVFVYFVPALSHLLALPVYFIEPMRLMLIITLAHTSQKNAYIIAATLPLFSFLVSAHPNVVKMLLITGELMFNIWLFFFLIKRFGNAFISMLGSIIISKVAYYAVKFLLLSTMILEGSLFATPLYIQVTMTLIFSGYIYLVLSRQKRNS